jgi:PBSX family phage terminase large subunit
MQKCPRCSAPLQKATALNKGTSEFWLECSSNNCNTFVNTYQPLPHQSAFHQDPSRFSANFGGFGSGKTLTSRQELYKHIFLTPNGTGLIGANVTSQYEQTIKRDIEADIPIQFIRSVSTQKSYIEFINGYRLIFRPFDDVDKLRSYNIDFFLIVEASEVKFEAFVQLKSRIRNTAATTLQADWRKGIIESNPDSGWIRTEILLKAHKVNTYGDVDTFPEPSGDLDTSLQAHVTSSNQNTFLPSGFLKDLEQSRPLWWVKRYIYGSFLYSEGLVYPSAMKHTIPKFDIPKHWKRICAFDYGLRDDAVFLFGAVDQRLNILFIYREIRVNNKNISDLANLFHEGAKDIPVGGWICAPIIDPKSAPRRDYDKKTLADHFVDYGINFQPGHVSLDARIYRLNTYLECGKLKIFNNCQFLIDELREYKFLPQSLDKNTRAIDKPEDKHNHGINALEWITMELPSDPKNLSNGVYSKSGLNLAELKRPSAIPYAIHALSDTNRDDRHSSDIEGFTGFTGVEYIF